MLPFNEPVDISKSILVCNVFHFLLSAAKASMYPFLTLYLRQLGFTAIQTGIIMGAKTLVAFVMAPIWSRCAVKGVKRRATLIFSLLMLSAMYLTITVIPTKFGNFDSCLVLRNNDTTPATSSSTNVKLLSSTSERTPIHTTEIAETTDDHYFSNDVSTWAISTEPSLTQTVTRTVTPTDYYSITTPANVNTSNTTTSTVSLSLPAVFITELQQVAAENGVSLSDLSLVAVEDFKNMINNTTNNTTDKYLTFLKNCTDDDLRLILDALKIAVEHRDGEESNGRHARSVRRSAINKTWEVVKSQVRHAAESLKDLSHQLFFVIFGVLLIGEMFASPVEKIADDAWYDFLDEIDYLDNYGKQRLWSAVAYVLFPILSAVLVDNTRCSLGFNVNHMAIHFYMFSGLLGLTLIVALFYPMPSSNRRKYVSKLLHGCSILFCKCRNVTYVLCLLVMGLCFSTSNYLFWVVADLGGQELPMGSAVAVAAFSELPMLLLSESLVKKFSNAGMVVVAIFALSVRLLYYSFLWTSWAVVPIELLYALSHTCMWWAVLSNPDFSFSNAVERSVRSILSSVYFGIGYGFGSLASGVVYDFFGYRTLYRGAAVLAVAWTVIFVILQKILPKDTKIKYKKLLQGDDDDDELSDESTRNMEHDWLEQALRDR